MDSEKTYKAAIAHVTVAQVAGEAVLLDFQSGQYFGLNSTGTRIWEIIQQPATRNEIARILFEECEDVQLDVLMEDTHKFLEQLETYSLVETATESCPV